MKRTAIVNKDIAVCASLHGEHSSALIEKGTLVQIINKFYNYLIHGYYCRVSIDGDDKLFFVLPEDLSLTNHEILQLPETKDLKHY